MSSILYLERKDIDVRKWNACISNSENENIYGYAEYLDIMAVHWDALVINDYQAVMALPWKQKLGKAYIYTPRFTSPLAIYGDIPESIKIKDILDFIPMKFRLWDLNLVNNLSLFSPSAVKRKNHILNLMPEYELLRKNYRPSYRNLVKKAEAMGNYISKEILIDTVIRLADGKKNINGTAAHDYACFKKIYNLLEKKGNAVCYGNFSRNNELIAASVFFFSQKRIYYMLAWNNQEGRRKGASHQLIDAVIREYAGKNYWLDFEGSDIPGIAFFFEGFGATTEDYYFLRVNRLPWWCRWIKK